MTKTVLNHPGRVVYKGRDTRIRALLPLVIGAVRVQGLVLPDVVLESTAGPAGLDRLMLDAVRMATGYHDPREAELRPAPIGPWAADRSGGAITTPDWRGSVSIVFDRTVIGRTTEDDLIELLGHHLAHAAQIHAAGTTWTAGAAHHLGLKRLAPQWVARRRDQLADDESTAQALIPTILAAVRDEIPTLF